MGHLLSEAERVLLWIQGNSASLSKVTEKAMATHSSTLAWNIT